MDHPFLADDPCVRAIGRRPEFLAQQSGQRFGYAVQRQRSRMFAIIDRQYAVRGAAEGVRLFEDCVEHRAEIAGRGVDYLQHLGHRCLAGERLVAFGCPVVQLRLRFVQFGFSLGNFSLTPGKLTLQIGYKLLGIG
jgi:hypothetical protein